MSATTQSTTDMPPRRRSRSEGSSKAAASVRDALQSQVYQKDERASCSVRFSVTELYVRTSDGVVFQDENFQRETLAKAERLVETALSPESSERNALIAKKALRYRQMRARRPVGGGENFLALRTQSCPAASP